MSNKIVTGVDVDQRGIRTVTLQLTKHSYRLLKVKVLTSDRDILAENHAIKHQATVNNFIKLRKSLPFWHKTIAMVLPETAVMGRLILFDELDSNLSVELGLRQILVNEFPISMDALYVDYAKGQNGYFVHAVKRDVIESRLAVTKQAGLKLTLVDTEKQALGHYLSYAMQLYGRKAWMLIDISLTDIRLVFCLNEQWFFRHFVCAEEMPETAVLEQYIVDEIQRFESFHYQVEIRGIWIIAMRHDEGELVTKMQHRIHYPVEWLDPWLDIAGGRERWNTCHSPALVIGATFRAGEARHYEFDAV